MTTANAITGTTGYRLLSGLDTYGGGVKVDNAYHENPILTFENKGDWENIMLVNLINSNVGGLNKIGRTLELSGLNLFTHCKYARKGNNYFLKLQNKIFRIYGNNVTLVKSK